MTRPSGHHGDLGKKEVETGDERGAPIHPNDPSQSSLVGLEQEKDGALGVTGGQPDVPPSGPNNINSSPEPKVKILFYSSWARVIINALLRLISPFRVKSDFCNKNSNLYIIVHVNTSICVCIGSHHYTFTLQLCNLLF